MILPHTLNQNLAALFYADWKIKIYRSEIQDSIIRLFAQRPGKRAQCPLCFKNSYTVRSFYFRTLIDLPIVGKKVFILLKIRRFACKNVKCLKLIFSEQCNDITTPYSRRTERATGYLRQILIEISSNKGAYFSKVMQIPVSNNTCLRLIKSMIIPQHDNLFCVGIDDWAKRKGMNYGSILVNAETGRTVDLLNSRDSNDVVDWFSAHQNVKYVTRDRATSYASAIKKSVPDVTLPKYRTV